jgi:hypothetical protein
LDFGNKKHTEDYYVAWTERNAVPASVASNSIVGRVFLTISLSLAITAHHVVNWPKALGGENKKERSKPFRSLLNSNHHCAGLPRHSRGNASTLQKALSSRKQYGSWIGVFKSRIRRQARRRQALKMKSFLIARIAIFARDPTFLVAI